LEGHVSQISGLMEYIAATNPRRVPPTHLSAIVARLERARLEPLRLTISIPPRWWKTITVTGAGKWHLDQDPSLQIIYASYAQRIAEKKSRQLRDECRTIGIPLSEDASSRSDWRTGIGDGGCWATGVEGALIGEGGDLVICDDLHKDRASAESALQRDTIFDWFNSVLMTRLEPSASVVVIGHRWHDDDIIGRLIAQGWEHIAIPALNEAGESNFPSRFPTEALLKTKEQIGEYSWASLYMQRPKPKGGQLFGDVVYYDALPERFTITIGLDLAYSERSSSDYSVAIVMARAGGISYVLDVVRVQEQAPKFQARLAGLRTVYPGAAWRSYLAGTEKGVADVFSYLGTDVGALRPIGDKFIRAQPVSAAWNAGKVLLPKSARWLNAFVEELKTFTGVKDRHDDQVDALAAAFDAHSTVVEEQAYTERSARAVFNLAVMAGAGTGAATEAFIAAGGVLPEVKTFGQLTGTDAKQAKIAAERAQALATWDEYLRKGDRVPR
jgi:predicted phage terminase large subunit-like protein